MLDKSQSGPGSGNPVNAVVGFEAPVFLGYVGILKVQADMGDVRILIVACIDDADALSIFVKDFRIGKHAEILSFHLGQGVIRHCPAAFQMRLYFHKDCTSCYKTKDEKYGNHLEQGLQQPSDSSQYTENDTKNKSDEFFNKIHVKESFLIDDFIIKQNM